MGLTTELHIREEDNSFFVNVEGEGLGLLIGKRGQTLKLSSTSQILQLIRTVAKGSASSLMLRATGSVVRKFFNSWPTD
jgi:predicted RNA-binding protein Jag